jgi:hypothetical protein
MELRKSEAKAIQRGLQKLGLYTKAIDGDLGANSLTAANAYLMANASRLPNGFQGLSNKRKFVASLQMLCMDADFDPGLIDGWMGANTRNAATQYIRSLDGLEIFDVLATEPIDVNPNNWPSGRSSDLNAFYGTPRKDNGCSDIETKLVRVASPWRMPLEWNRAKARTSFRVHEKVETSLERVLTAIEASYSSQEVERLGLNRFAGDYNCRTIRRGSRMSTHAYGISIDFYSSRNELDRTTNSSQPPTLAHVDCLAFWEAFENEGWYSLGRSENYDWMHIQAAKGKASRFYNH